jgi:hypothetical protein
VLIHGEQARERKKRVALEKLDGISIHFADENFVVDDLGVLLILDVSLGQPPRHPFARAAEDEVRVLVINRREGMKSLRILPDENVVLFGHAETGQQDSLALGEDRPTARAPADFACPQRPI